MSYFNNKFRRVVFLIVSDDIPWCRRHIPANNVIFSDSKSAGVDLAIMSLCDHAIITVGSFGWWGGWLVSETAGGEVIYYDGYPRPNSEIDAKFVKEDYYPGTWIGIK